MARSDESRDDDGRGRPMLGVYVGGAALIALAVIALAMAGAPGCQDTNRTPRAQQFGTSESREKMNEQNLVYALSVLREIDESPSPDSLSTVIDRLNQWTHSKEPAPDWKPDPLLDSLPEGLRDLPAARGLSELRFPQSDGVELQQAVWLNGIARRASGEDNAPVAKALALFDWVVRNIQIEADAAIEVPHFAREVLVFGRGTATERAWLFALLARQEGLDVVMLALPGKDGSEPRPWLPALASDGELYLFDTRLGLPIPGPDGRPVATLREVLADPGLLRALDADERRPYPVKTDDLAKITVLVEASPIYLAQRMQMVESQLPGRESLVLSARPTALAERLASHPNVESVELWPLPYERLARREKPDRATRDKHVRELAPFLQPSTVLWQGRVLHILGDYDGPKSASALYQQARPADADIQQIKDKAHPQRRAQADAIAELLGSAKQDASYWLGLVAFERGNLDAAIDYFETRTLEASPGGPWTAGARYNLGRAYEAQGRADEAIGMYQADRSPQRSGNLLRARRLEEAAKGQKANEPRAAAP